MLLLTAWKEMAGLQLSSWVEYLAQCSSMLWAGSCCPCFCTWPLSLALLLYRLSLCSPLVQGPDEVGCIINVAASPVFCYCRGLSSKSNDCHPHYSCDFHKGPPRLGLLTVSIPTRRRGVERVTGPAFEILITPSCTF